MTANAEIKVSNLTATSLLSNTDLLLVVRGIGSTPTTNTISVSDLRTQIPVSSNTPANSTALTVQGGTMLYDSSFLYIAVANNVLKRIALNTF